ncbi:MAG: NCS2 family permease [Sedimentisphaerales bacterium]|nr:NCS2 family permease [Sedimentisphaerales bacterium]
MDDIDRMKPGSFKEMADASTAARFQLGKEILAGVTTFLTMAYIIFVNPDILSKAGMDQNALIAVTCLVTAIACILTGLIANAPIAMAPGMGLNAFFAYTLVLGSGGKVTWQTALGVVFLSGVFFLLLTLVGLRRKLVEAIPPSLIAAISVGIGLFITFIGLQNLGLIVNSDATLVQAAPLNRTILIGLAGLLVMVGLELLKMPGALLAGIVFSTILAVLFDSKVTSPSAWISLNTNVMDVAFQLDILGALKWGMFSSIFTLMFIDLFDSVGTLLAVAPQAGMVRKDGTIRALDRLLGLDALATMFGSLFGTSTTTSYIESAAGIEQGGRTGLTAVVTGLLFLLSTPFWPLVGMVPAYATAPALIMVGLFMMKNVSKIDFSDIRHGLPSFIIIVMIALSYSISTGLAFGFISYTLIQILTGKIGEIKFAMWIITLLSVVYFIV